MTLPEILHRTVQWSRRSADRGRSFDELRRGRPGPLPVFPGLLRALEEHRSPLLSAAILAAADAITDGHFEALGVAWPVRDPSDLFPADLWRLDPVTLGLWPGANAFASDVDYRHQRQLGSVKYVWEINRLQFLQPLAAAWALDHQPRHLAAIETAIASWWRANPPFRGVSWSSGIEIALRSLSLVAVSTWCGDALSAKTQAEIRAILAAGLHWLDRYPSLFSSANNHRVAEGFGVYLIAATAPDLCTPGQLEGARAMLEQEAQLQILADGVGAEQSPTYGALVAELLLTAALLARKTGHPLSPKVDRLLGAFGDWIGWIANPDGTVPSIGDDDEGCVWYSFQPPAGDYPTSVSVAIAAFLGSHGSGSAPLRPQLRDGVFGLPDAWSAPATGLRTFAQGGYSVVRETRCRRRVQLTLDHGPLGFLSIAAHGHADANAITLTIDGTPVLVDPGTYMYHAEDDWRDWFRGTRAHNTLSLDDEDQSKIIGPFMWSHKAAARLEAAEQFDDGWRLSAAHDGYRRRFGLEHHRTIEAAGDQLVITDRLDGAAPGAAEVSFQFAPGLEVTRSGTRILVSRDDAALLELEFDAMGDIRLSCGEPGLDGGWLSPGFGRKLPAFRLSWRGTPSPAGLKTTLRLPSAPEPEPVARQRQAEPLPFSTTTR